METEKSSNSLTKRIQLFSSSLWWTWQSLLCSHDDVLTNRPSELPQCHSFPPRVSSWLDFFHDWKLSLRVLCRIFWISLHSFCSNYVSGSGSQAFQVSTRQKGSKSRITIFRIRRWVFLVSSSLGLVMGTGVLSPGEEDEDFDEKNALTFGCFLPQLSRYLALFSRVFRLKNWGGSYLHSDSSSADCFLFFSSLLFLAFFSRYSWFSAGWCFWRWVSMEVVLSLPLGFSVPPLFTSLSGQLAIWQRTIDPLAGVLASRKLSQIGESLVLMSGIRFSFNDKILSGGEGAGVQPPSAVLTNHNLRNQILKLT